MALTDADVGIVVILTLFAVLAILIEVIGHRRD
jgi:hypothetical protein